MQTTLSARSLAALLCLCALLGGLAALGAFVALRPTPVEAAPATPAALQAAFADVASAVAPAVVNINTEQDIREQVWGWDLYNFDPFTDPRPPFRPYVRVRKATNLGTGFVISREGYVLTNAHVINRADRISVTMRDEKSYSAQVVKVIAERDLAVLKIDDAPKSLPTVRLGVAEKVRVGSWAIAVGSPFGFSESVTVGVISAKGRVVRQAQGRQEMRDLLQTDAAINFGNSGGPLLNIAGEVIGVNQAIFSPQGSGNIGIGFAIPMDKATKTEINQAVKNTRRI